MRESLAPTGGIRLFRHARFQIGHTGLKIDILTLRVEPLGIQRSLNECLLCTQERHALNRSGNLRFTLGLITLACPKFWQILKKGFFSEVV